MDVDTREKEKGVLLRRMTPFQVTVTLLLVLVVLAAVYMGSWGSYGAPVSARRAACLSNLKQDAQAALLYSEDHDGVCPPAAWMDAIEPHLKTPELLHCPGVRRENDSVFGYALHARMVGGNLDDVKQPETTPLIFDSTLLTRNAVGTLATLPAPPRHGGSNCIAYADGHAKATMRK